MLGQSDRQRDRALDEPLSGAADGRESAPSGGRRRDPCAARTDLSRASITIRQGLGLLPPATPLREPDCDVDDGAEQDDPKPIGRRVAPFARIGPHAEALAVPIRSGAHPERLEEYKALTEATIKVKTPHLRRFHGASRTRTGDLLGAIQIRTFDGTSRLFVTSLETSSSAGALSIMAKVCFTALHSHSRRNCVIFVSPLIANFDNDLPRRTNDPRARRSARLNLGPSLRIHGLRGSV